MGKIAGWYRRRLRGEGPLAPIGLAIGGMLALALAIATAVTITGLHFLHVREFQPEPQLSAATLYELLKISFAVAAGIGGVVALVTAYRRQRVAEFAQDLAGRAEEREAARLLNERFTMAAGQLGDGQPAVRLAGVYAMAGLADDWPQQRQTCVDVLCAYLRMPYEPDPDDEAPPASRQAFQALREVHRTVIRVITAHLQPDGRRAPTAQDWRGLNLDLTGTILDGGSFRGAQFTGGTVDFTDAKFTGGTVSFRGTLFSGGTVDFTDAKFTGGTVHFSGAKFTGGTVHFSDAKFSGGMVSFTGAQFSGGVVHFSGAQFSGGAVHFSDAQFSGGVVDFSGALFSGGTVDFDYPQFTGGTVDLRVPGDWSAPPRMPSWTTPPPGVLLPGKR